MATEHSPARRCACAHHAAWIVQRLEDDGPDADAPTIPTEAGVDFAAYLAAGGRFDLATWWTRYADDYAEVPS